MKLEKTFKNEGGNLLVRATDTCGIVEIVHLYNDNKSGCVIGYWNKVKSDDEFIAEFSSVGSRLTTVNYKRPEMLLEILKFGQKLAEMILEINNEI